MLTTHRARWEVGANLLSLWAVSGCSAKANGGTMACLFDDCRAVRKGFSRVWMGMGVSPLCSTVPMMMVRVRVHGMTGQGGRGGNRHAGSRT
jgi:hypothetical protein